MLRSRPYVKYEGVLRPPVRKTIFTVAGEATHLVAVVRGLVGTVDRDVEVLRLRGREHGELHVELLEVSAGDFLVQLLGEHVDTERELLRACPESDLGKHLVGERARHH